MTDYFVSQGMIYGWAWFLATVIGILLIALPLLLAVAMIIYAERKIWAAIALRRGPNVVGPWGLLQSFADGLKVFLKETIVPTSANKGLFLIAPIVTFTTALIVWAVVPFQPGVVLADVNVGLLYVLAASSLGVYGVIVAKPSSPLSHINILAKGWNIPNVYIKDADKLFRQYDTYVFRLEANLDDYKFDRASADDVKKIFKSPDEQVPPADLNTTKLAGLREMRKADSIRYGSKSANLGEMLHARMIGVTVPDGFTAPFHWYAQFIKDNGLDKVINDLMDNNDFVHNPRVRRQKLEEFRNSIQNGKFDDILRADIIARWKTQLGGKPVFVRSSSNSEDLPNFSGAGLYSSVPNVVTEDKLIDAVKKVWASLWKFEAYEARVRNYVSQSDVYMSALIQLGVDMERGGVMITKDPFDDKSKNSVYISAVCGHNSKVVDNTGIPEQVLFNPRSNSVVVMTLSQQENALEFDPNGDLRASTDTCAGANKRVLTDLETRALARAAIRIRTVFGGRKDQDIEWGILKNKIYIVQARPYIDKK